ncbi:glycosyltransferase family 2 protein [Hymenobacter metallicola]|uniref:Glycosyltransferase n=1 Tax=Hymenobacter metallicola TaxID=2563114 RepID=A0A4Z0Q0X0_9BACT|nr:glycosyltransferase [Hymenobacter metallicola]TGE23234.1 glycosyltransferase [Hymenobacter metallicola]
MPTVSVCCITYNHEKFLAQAIESVLMQETDFAVELVLGEDCSTDSTRQIALDFQRRYPDRIRLLLPENNLGVMGNFLATLKACTGTYIALLEGDDYWTSPHKLQRQVDILERHASCTTCIHDAEEFMDDNSIPPRLFSQKYSSILPGHEHEFTQADIALKGWFIPTASMLFRRSALFPIPEWVDHAFSGDYSLHLLLTRTGNIYYLPEVMSRYRLHPGGIMSATQNERIIARNKKQIFETAHYKQMVDARHHGRFNEFLEGLHFDQSKRLKATGQIWSSYYSYYKAISAVSASRTIVHLKQLVYQLVKGAPPKAQ